MRAKNGFARRLIPPKLVAPCSGIHSEAPFGCRSDDRSISSRCDPPMQDWPGDTILLGHRLKAGILLSKIAGLSQLVIVASRFKIRR